MIIKVDKYSSETIPDLIVELGRDEEIVDYMVGQSLSFDWLEAVASHMVATDTDYTD